MNFYVAEWVFAFFSRPVPGALFHRARIVEGRQFRLLSSFCIESSWYSFISPNFKENWRAELANTVTTSHVWLFKSKLHKAKSPFLSHTNHISSGQLPYVASGCRSKQAERDHFHLLDSSARELN